jgi:TPP-dependent pyruvate/acetoin dehydrogenase alpha subunit
MEQWFEQEAEKRRQEAEAEESMPSYRQRLETQRVTTAERNKRIAAAHAAEIQQAKDRGEWIEDQDEEGL